MIFHENHLLADDSHVISYLIFVKKLRKMSNNLSSAAVVIGALRVKYLENISRLLIFAAHALPRNTPNIGLHRTFLFYGIFLLRSVDNEFCSDNFKMLKIAEI